MFTLTLVALLAGAVGCGKKDEEAPPKQPAEEPVEPAPTAVQFDEDMWQFFAPLPEVFANEANPITEDKVALGRMLYYDARLSKNHDVSCNSCHDLDAYGVDNKPKSPGHKGQLGGRNSPTVYNAGGYIAQFWDGRAADVEEQALGPILNPVEMAMPNDKRALATVKSIPQYVELFGKAFPDDKKPLTYANLGKAIGAFERQLITRDRFDAFLGGDKSQLTNDEQRGLALFFDLGCTTCHNGPAIGGNSYQKLGLVNPYPDESDLGRYEVTKAEEDKMKFRVPTLRNVAKTHPYFMNGSIETLDECVRKMAWHQIGKEIDDAQAALLVTFLGSLTGELPTGYIAKPELPPSTGKTPKPDPS